MNQKKKRTKRSRKTQEKVTEIKKSTPEVIEETQENGPAKPVKTNWMYTWDEGGTE